MERAHLCSSTQDRCRVTEPRIWVYEHSCLYVKEYVRLKKLRYFTCPTAVSPYPKLRFNIMRRQLHADFQNGSCYPELMGVKELSPSERQWKHFTFQCCPPATSKRQKDFFPWCSTLSRVFCPLCPSLLFFVLFELTLLPVRHTRSQSVPLEKWLSDDERERKAHYNFMSIWVSIIMLL